MKTELPGDVAFIGFCGAPWTVASYMIAGKGTPDQAPARLFAFRHHDAFQQLIDRLVEASVDYLLRQIDAGVEVVQIFDSWAGVLPANEFDAWCAKPIARMVAMLKEKRPDNAGHRLRARRRRASAGSHAPPRRRRLWPRHGARRQMGGRRDRRRRSAFRAISIRLALIAGGEALDREIDTILEAFRGRPHIFNLGHGILPQTPIENVERLVARVRRG